LAPVDKIVFLVSVNGELKSPDEAAAPTFFGLLIPEGIPVREAYYGTAIRALTPGLLFFSAA